jgi:hypothetical protein
MLIPTSTNVYTPLSRPLDGIVLPLGRFSKNVFSGADPEFGRVVFQSTRALTADASTINDANENRSYLYSWSNGALELLSYLPVQEGGGPVIDTTVGLGGGYDGIHATAESPFPGEHAVSIDGARVYFSTNIASEGSRTLYLRQGVGSGSASTLRVDASERTDCAGDPDCGGDRRPDLEADPAGDLRSHFQLASADGSVAFFTSAEKLTDDARANQALSNCSLGCDLYRWDANAPVGKRLTDLTTADPTGGGAGGAQDLRPSLEASNGSGGVIGGSDDGRTLYFVATGDLAEGASAGGLNLYLWRDGSGVRHIADLAASDFEAWTVDPHRRQFGARVSADGERLLIRSRVQLTNYPSAGHAQIYLYDASDDQFRCVSCKLTAAASTGDAYLKQLIPTLTNATPPWKMRNLSGDGSRVFFDSQEALVADDVNATIDVYEWRDDGSPDGTIGLISGGRSPQDSYFVDANASGDDVFFATRAQLDCRDTDALVDIYDARVGGGFGPCPVPPACNDDTCQGPPAPPPSTGHPTTSRFHGQGNQPKTRQRAKAKRCKRGYKRKTIRGKSKCVKTKKKKRNNRRASRR